MDIRTSFTNKRRQYRSYKLEHLTDAYNFVLDSGLPVERIAKQFGVPVSTLKDRVRGRVNVDTVKSGPQPIFQIQDEEMLASHISTMAEVGYGYSRQETINLATDFAIHLGLRDKEHPLSLQWLHNFLSRWPDLKVRKPRSLDVARAKNATESVISKYFTELKTILDKFHLVEKPQRIFNIDEKGLTVDHKPPKIVASNKYKAQAVTAGRSKTVTLIGCVSAVGQQVPPYFIFPGQRMVDSLLEGASAGVTGTVSQSGWSNTEIFESYMKEYLAKYLPERDENNQVLVLYDGHRSHVSISLIQWAKEHHIVLFVLPPHCSHLLQPLDVCCYGPFEIAWNAACHRHLRESAGTMLTRYDVCRIACKVYTTILTPSNIKTAFKKCGIFPFNSCVVPSSAVAPASSFTRNNEHVDSSQTRKCATEQDNGEKFLEMRGGKILENVKVAKVRNTLSKVVGGKAITEDNIYKAIQEHTTTQANKRKPANYHENSQKKAKHFQTPYKIQPVAGTSGVLKAKPNKTNKKCLHSEDSESSENEIEDSEKYIICHQFTPADIHLKPFLAILKWGCCDKCNGWVHLSFCTEEKVLRRGDPVKMCLTFDRQCTLATKEVNRRKLMTSPILVQR